ncbi:fimbria/pilus outer membrane usher protein [Sphingomonas qomolangmaensis]|uniref:Fimbrial biogenesis outer membrane usher protein n=1 Tax=Sphingomonas qomolangmaensis TaxID=2918765 RepID=A0ABY5L752_9SPHN|nr:hypothetical protein [Sphingomonas qomolangmaensis]UUL81438.1 hypothetical protein NMP03_09445 [Sphingomonas qomolangmaensis]
MTAPLVATDTSKPSDQEVSQVTDNQDTDALFRQVFGTDRPAPAAGEYSVLVDDINVGDYRITPGTSDDGSIDAGLVRNALLPIALPELAAKLRSVSQKPTVAFQDLRSLGLDVTFDPGQLVLRIRVPSSLRNVRELILRTARRRQDIDYADQAVVSAYASFRAGVDVIAQTTTRDRGVSGKAADIDLGANLFGVAAQARFRYDERRRNRWSRGDIRLTYDDVSRLIRYELGDLSVGTRPFQLAPRMAGISAYREYPIDPYRNIRPISERGFELDRPARVEIVLNGVPARSFDLPAGRFSLRDFPLVPSAANDIELRITYATGEVKIISFPAFYDIELLSPGLIDFALNLGVPYRDDDRGRVYDSGNYNLLGYVRYGLSDTLTIGANIEGDRQFNLVGAEGIWASPIGSIALNIGTNANNPGLSSSRVALQYAWRDADAQRGRAIDALLTVTGEDYRSLNGIFGSNLITTSASLRAGQMINQRTRMQGYGGYEEVRGFGSRYYVGTNISYQFPWGSLAIGGEYQKSPEETGPVVRASLSVPLGRGALNASYTSQNNASRVEYNRLAALGVGAIGMSAGAEHRDDFDRQFARMSYIGNRFEAAADLTRSTGQSGQNDLRTGLSFGSSIVMADGAFAIGRPISNSFALVDLASGAADYQLAVEPRQGFGSTTTRYTAYSGTLGPAVIPNLPAYFDRTIQVDAPSAPAGTSVGGQIFVVRPGYRSGFKLLVGSDNNASLIGTLVDKVGKPVSFASGQARKVGAGEKDEPLLIFTNGSGRFFLENVAQGTSYEITISAGDIVARTTVSVPSETVGIHRIEQPVPLDLEMPARKGDQP